MRNQCQLSIPKTSKLTASLNSANKNHFINLILVVFYDS